MLLQWRRGVRGLEYNTLFAMVKELGERGGPDNKLGEVRDLLVPFIEKAKSLLILERHAIQNGYISYAKCDDKEIKDLRAELFSESKSHGGKFKELVDVIDKHLYFCL